MSPAPVLSPASPAPAPRAAVLCALSGWGAVAASDAWARPEAHLTPLVNALEAARAVLPTAQWVSEWERASRTVEDVDAYAYLQIRRAGGQPAVAARSTAWRRWLDRVWWPRDRRWMTGVLAAADRPPVLDEVVDGWRETLAAPVAPGLTQMAARAALRSATGTFERHVARVRFTVCGQRAGLSQLWGLARTRDHEARHGAFAAAASAVAREAAGWDTRWRAVHQAWWAVARAEGHVDPLALAAADQGLDECVPSSRLESVALWWRQEVAPVMGWCAAQRAHDLGLTALTVCDTDALASRMPAPPATPDALWALCARLWDRLDPAWLRVLEVARAGGWVALSASDPQLSGWEAMYAARDRLPTMAGRLTGHPDDVFSLLHESGHALHYVSRDRYPTLWHRDVARDLDEVVAIGMEALGLAAIGRTRRQGRAELEEAAVAAWSSPAVRPVVAAEWVWQQLRVCGQSLAGALWQAWVWRQPAGRVRLLAAAEELLRIRRWLGVGETRKGVSPDLARLLFLMKTNLWDDVGYCFEYVPAAVTALWVWRESSRGRRNHDRMIAAWKETMAGPVDTLPGALAGLGAPSVQTAQGRRVLSRVIRGAVGAPRGSTSPAWARPVGSQRVLRRWLGARR